MSAVVLSLSLVARRRRPGPNIRVEGSLEQQLCPGYHNLQVDMTRDSITERGIAPYATNLGLQPAKLLRNLGERRNFTIALHSSVDLTNIHSINFLSRSSSMMGGQNARSHG